MRTILAVTTLLFVASCASKKKAPAVAASLPQRPQKEYVDLQAGWRVQIVAPITIDGTNKVLEDQPAQSDQATQSITLKTSKNLVGFETAFWELEARPGGGVRLRLASALLTKEGVPEPISAPTKALLHLTKNVRFLRLFYLIRKSESDHEMVIAGVDRADRLDPFTDELKANPSATCHNSAHIYCEWIPYGMAVRPEMKRSDGWSPIY